jgi:hypothetical protein
MSTYAIEPTQTKNTQRNYCFDSWLWNGCRLGAKVVLLAGALFPLFSPVPVKAQGLPETAPILESMELEFLESDPKVYIEIEQECTEEGCDWAFRTPDEDIASQLIFRWGGEIHCQHRILKLEVDHPSTFEDSHAFDLADGAIFSTLKQTLPTKSPFKQGLVGTFKAQSFQVEDLKEQCLAHIHSGDLDPYSEEEKPEFFVQGEGANRLFLRGTCSTTGGLPTEMFNQPSAGANQPDGVPYSPYATVVCHAPGSPYAGLFAPSGRTLQFKNGSSSCR